MENKKVNEDEVSADTRAAARKFYEAYTANSDNLNFRGEQCPSWEELTPAVRSHWCAVVISSDPSLYK